MKSSEWVDDGHGCLVRTIWNDSDGGNAMPAKSQKAHANGSRVAGAGVDAVIAAEPAPLTIAVSRHALVRRLGHALRRQGQALRADRHGGGIHRFVLDVERKQILETGVDLESLARRLEVLRPWETLEGAGLNPAG
jgi:hypothetical protein